MNTFEQSLLTELRDHVATPTPTPVRSARARRARRWRWAALPAAVAASATAAVVAVSGPTPAYAIDESRDDIVVTIYRLDDAAGLEQALHQHGVAAEVDYDSGASVSVGDDGGRSLDTGTGPEQGERQQESDSTADGPGDDSAPKIEAILSEEDAFTIRLDRDSIPEDQVLHLSTMGSADDGLAALRIAWFPS
ncbi:hypothetical protein [Nocardioides sp. NPDC006273]|uniref:hypothetical protein n=1 Tax=Nocardioides sp. NPDC006273 TaxID=3155598 RepID=UPI0033ABAD27